MFIRSRREFTQKALFSPLSALLVAKATAQSQASRRKFFDGFKREQITTSGATINVVHGGKGSPVLLLHGIRKPTCSGAKWLQRWRKISRW